MFQLSVFSTLMATTLGRTLRTASTMGVSRLKRGSPWLEGFSVPAPQEAVVARTATTLERSVLRILESSFRQPGDLPVPGKEAHGFPSPPRDGFGFVVDVRLVEPLRLTQNLARKIDTSGIFVKKVAIILRAENQVCREKKRRFRSPHKSSVNGVPVSDYRTGHARANDWFFAGVNDLVSGKNTSDVLTAIQ
jgi:hypothetical protein